MKVPDIGVVTDDERRFIAWARHSFGSVTELVVKFDERGDQLNAQEPLVAAARAVLAVFEDIGRDGLELFTELETLAARVREMDS